jgi:hypothetical protein
VPSVATKLLATAGNITAFLDSNAARIGPNIATTRHDLDDAVTQLAAMVAAKAGTRAATRGTASQRKVLRASLRTNHMKPIAIVAKLKLSGVPELAALRMPPKSLASAALVAAAKAMAVAATQYDTVFTGVGFPNDFVAQLTTAADAVTAVAVTPAVVQVPGAATGITQQQTQVRGLFLLLDALVIPRLNDDPVLLAKWKAARASSTTAPIPVAASAPAALAATSPSTPVASS